MSLTKHVGVSCDDCGDVVGECSPTAKQARSAAADAGWFRQGDQDLCPSCVTGRAAPVAKDIAEA